jgi:hypothetical protein
VRDIYEIPLKTDVSGLKQVMSLFTLGSARAVLVVALVYSFLDVFNVIMALISSYPNQPFIVLVLMETLKTCAIVLGSYFLFVSG